MKQFLLTNFILLFLWSAHFQLFAQNDKKEKDRKVRVKIETIENGKQKSIDTTFVVKPGEDIDKLLEKNKLKVTGEGAEQSRVYVFVASDDSTKGGKQNIRIDMHKQGPENKIVIMKNDGNKHKIVVNEEVIEINENDNNRIMVFKTLSGDTTKPGQKIFSFRSKGLPGDTVFTLFDKSFPEILLEHPDSLFAGGKFWVFTDSLKRDGQIKEMKVIRMNKDSIEKMVRKKLGDKQEMEFHFFPDDNMYQFRTDDSKPFRWHGYQSVSGIRLEEAKAVDLELIKLPKKIKTLELQYFTLILDRSGKTKLSFKTPGKGNLSLKVYDDFGKQAIEMELQNFDGNFEKAFSLPAGTHILQISMDKKHFIRKLILE
jgi:hypothetical protein